MMLRSHLLRRNEPALRDAFHDVLLRDAPAIAAGIPGIRHYAMNAVIDQSYRMKIEPGPFKLDGITHMWFEDQEAMERILPQSALSSTMDSAARIISNFSTFLVREVRFS